ncbi:MAG: alpha,alpha-trehalase TreA [Sphingobacteriales bacterium]|nr:alpha,alpha-trehalase TreA [Sphingobacteriales bacterium]
MKNIFRSAVTLLCLLIVEFVNAQIKTPDQIYGELFKRVQMEKVFADGKIFVDLIPKQSPAIIMNLYTEQRDKKDFSLKYFVETNFEFPKSNLSEFGVKEHIKTLWKTLERKPDIIQNGSSLIPLPYSYIVPGGRFREIYYWDSYFTMLGLEESGEFNTIENMVKNFAFLIDQFGHIPNGNRTYYLSRSQPPFFALMVELLSKIKGQQIYREFLPELLKEHRYWTSENRLIKLSDTDSLSRYWDERDQPRQESYREDVLVAEKSGRKPSEIYQNLRAAAASGWDFSTRWFNDSQHIETIKTANIIPVDLNALLYRQEMIIAHALDLIGETQQAKLFRSKAALRLQLIEKYCWNKEKSFYTDYDFKKQQQQLQITAAGLVPLFAIENQSLIQQHLSDIVKITKANLLKAGGVVTTTVNSGQQWDAPNGWAPLEWMAIKGFHNYREKDLAATIAKRWIALNIKVYQNTGKLMEKYNVDDLSLKAGGGEYETQDGFGWTNGVLLKLLNMYPQYNQ